MLTDQDRIERLPWALLVALAIAYSLAFIDRAIVGLVMEDISRDLEISRAYTSLLVGSGFAFVYAAFGILAAVFFARVHPRHTIAGGIVVWSIATVACGLAQSPEQFLAARMLVGAGEATLVPAAYAWIPARSPAKRVGISIACFTVGVALGSGISMGAGGQIIETISASLGSSDFLGLSPWRIVLLALGVVGLPIALHVWLVDRSPIEFVKAAARSHWPDLRAPALLFVGFGCCISIVYVQLFWAHTFYGEMFGLTLSASALVIGIAVALSAVGAIVGGIIGDRLAEKGFVLPHTLMKIGMNVVQIATFAIAFTVPILWISVVAYMIAMTAHGAIGATMGPTISQIFSPDRRAVATSVCLAVGTSLGLGIVMPLVGMFGTDFGIQTSILVGSIALLITANLFLYFGRLVWRAGHPIPPMVLASH